MFTRLKHMNKKTTQQTKEIKVQRAKKNRTDQLNLTTRTERTRIFFFVQHSGSLENIALIQLRFVWLCGACMLFV